MDLFGEEGDDVVTVWRPHKGGPRAGRDGHPCCDFETRIFILRHVTLRQRRTSHTGVGVGEMRKLYRSYGSAARDL